MLEQDWTDTEVPVAIVLLFGGAQHPRNKTVDIGNI